MVEIGRDMHNRNQSIVSIDPGSQINVTSNYYQDATSVLRFGVETNSAGEPLNARVSVGGTAAFETGATLQYHSNVGLLEFDTYYTNLIIEADQLVVGGVANAVGNQRRRFAGGSGAVGGKPGSLWLDRTPIPGRQRRHYVRFQDVSPRS